MKIIDINVAICPDCEDWVDVIELPNGIIQLYCPCGYAKTLSDVAIKCEEEVGVNRNDKNL